MQENQNVTENLSIRGVMRLKKQFIYELAGNITWTAQYPEATGRLSYDWEHFVVRKAMSNQGTGREAAGYIVFRHVETPIQQQVYSALEDHDMTQDSSAQPDRVRNKIQAIMALAYHCTCKRTHAGISDSITPDVMAALAPVMGVMNMIENAIVHHIKAEKHCGMLTPLNIAAKFRLTEEERFTWQAHRQARADAEAIMRNREIARAAPAAPWTLVGCELAGEGMPFSINGLQQENWTDHYRNLQAQDRPVPAVGSSISGQSPERMDVLHLQIYAEQLNDIISQKQQHRIRGDYLARVRQSSVSS